MEKDIRKLNVKLTVDEKDIYETEEYPFILAIGEKDCGFSDDGEDMIGGKMHLEFSGSLNNATALIPAIISTIISTSDMKKDQESIMKYLNVISVLVLDYMEQNKLINNEEKTGVMH